MPGVLLGAGLGLVAGGAPAGSEIALAQAAGPFDGNWATSIVCPTYGDARGYTFRFISQVVNGQLQGQYGTPGRPSSLTLSGVVQPNGAATLQASGMTGDPDYTPGHSAQGSSIFYHISARFEPTRGTGARQETRPCEISFVRQ